MAKAGKRRIPAKQGTKRGRTAPKKAIRKIVEPVAQSGPRKVLVRALRLGEYDGKYRAPNEEFTMEADGELPYWVTKVGSD